MKYFISLFAILVSLLGIILLLYVTPVVGGATGSPHPSFAGMFISETNIDHSPHTRWLGYLFGIGIILLFGTMLLIGNRKKGRLTSIGPWIYCGVFFYLLAYSFMVFSHWAYDSASVQDFVFYMPAPTAWMIYAVWFVPLLITIGYIVKFEDAIISEEEISDFREFLDTQTQTKEDGNI